MVAWKDARECCAWRTAEAEQQRKGLLIEVVLDIAYYVAMTKPAV